MCLSSLQYMLKSNEILSVIIRGNIVTSDTLQEFSDGLIYKESEFFRSNACALQVVLYFDEFEVVNPLGSKKGKQKLAAVYMALANINAFERSDLKSIQLLLLCPVIDVKEFGLNKCLEPLIFDLKVLETEGVFVEELKTNLKGTVAYICAANLGSHQIGGFMESFGNNTLRICRFCMATSEEIQYKFDPVQFQERNETTYNYHLGEIEKDQSLISVYGLKKDSISNELKYFHITRGLPPDVMHDLLEGCVKKEITIVLKQLVSDSVITEKEIISKIRIFHYGQCDITSKPAEPRNLGT